MAYGYVPKIVYIPPEKDVPLGMIVPAPEVNGEQPGMITGNWRRERPVFDPLRCTQCRSCEMLCPDACISIDEKGIVDSDMKYCKGCGVCAFECRDGAIAMVPELDFADGVVRLETVF
jgi:2-oxoacid:acceptor oxidoreductase delta subunit (pyruvate/2-ketoisovalerate family)